jgi:hypothetical protein
MNNTTTLEQNPKPEQPQAEKPQPEQPENENKGWLNIAPSSFGQKVTNDPKNWD